MNKIRLILFCTLVFLVIGLSAQVVFTEPAFPTQSDDIVLFFDASEGNAGLMDFTGEVYAHMGLITNTSTSPTDWKYVVGVWGTEDARTLMTRVGPNLYSLAYNIESFHGVLPGDSVEQLAFVFRNGDGSRSGRASDGSDIYLEVFPPDDGLRVTLNSPTPNTIVKRGEMVDVDLLVNKEAMVTISDNGNEIYNQSTTAVELQILGDQLGGHQLEISVDDGSEVIELERTYFVLEDQDSRLPRPDWLSPFGLTYAADSYGFALVAPGKDHVFLLCDDNDYSVDLDYRLSKDLDGNTFWIEIPKSNFTEESGMYQFLVDGEVVIADPYSELVLDPWNDEHILDQDFFPSYPTDRTTGFVTVFDLEQKMYPWEVTDFDRPEKEELVIYELLMRDFLEDKSYESLLDTLDYLSRLGINAIELMPIQEFEGNNSWGYNPSFHSAIDKYYGSKEQLQRVVDRCHQLGIAVIIDVVYNHAFSQSPFCQLFWDPVGFRPTADNPWLNVTARHPFNVGYDFNHESEFTQDWVKESLRRLIEELNVDGFRFDLSKGLTQFNSGGNASLMSRYDQSRIDIITDYAEHIWGFDNDLYVILEHFADNDEERELASKGMLLWSNTTFQFAEAAMGYNSDLTGASYKSRGFSEPSLIAYMESHDEERIGYKIKTWGNSSPLYNTKDPWTFSDRLVATAAVYLSIPGPKMLWQFGELGYDESINRCEDGSVSANCRLSSKPIRWSDLEIDNRRHTYNRLSALLYLRSNNPVFHTPNFSLHDDDYFKRVKLNGADMNVVTLANFDINSIVVSGEFQHTGLWFEYLTGERLPVTDVDMAFSLKPGEVRIYTSREVLPPDGFFTSTEEEEETQLRLYPNPVVPGNQLVIVDEQHADMTIIDGQGREIAFSTQRDDDLTLLTLPEGLPAGLYFLRLSNQGNVRTVKFVVVNP